jgi:hypothetical protein
LHQAGERLGLAVPEAVLRPESASEAMIETDPVAIHTAAFSAVSTLAVATDRLVTRRVSAAV